MTFRFYLKHLNWTDTKHGRHFYNLGSYSSNRLLSTAWIKAWEMYPDCPPPALWWNRGQVWNATPVPLAACRGMCTVHTSECQVFNFLYAVIIVVHLTDRFKCHMSLLRTRRPDIKCLVKLLKSYIHPATAFQMKLFISFPSPKPGSQFLCGTTGCLSIELSHK